MELEKALSQISEIREQIAKGEVYRGYKSLPLAVSGVIALGAAWLQTAVIIPASNVDYVHYWLVVGAVCGALSSSDMLYNYLFRENAYRRQKTRRVFGQFAPCLVAGAVTTFCFLRLGPQAVLLLPGTWAVLFSLGIFSCRPYLPRAIGWVALYYLAASAFLLWSSAGGSYLSPWGMGITFGIGQILTALVHYWDIERKEHA